MFLALCLLLCGAVCYCRGMTLIRVARTTRRACLALMAAGMGAGLAVPALTHDAPMGAWVALDGRLPERHDAPNVPTWENTDRTANRAGCVTPTRMTGIPSHLLVSSREGVTRRVQWTPAVDRHLSRVNNNTRTDDDTFVIGLCVTQ